MLEKRYSIYQFLVVATIRQAVFARTRLGTTALKSAKVGADSIFVLVSGYDAMCLLGVSASQTYSRYPMAKKKNLSMLLHLVEAAIQAYSIFIRHGYLQHVACG